MVRAADNALVRAQSTSVSDLPMECSEESPNQSSQNSSEASAQYLQDPKQVYCLLASQEKSNGLGVFDQKKSVQDKPNPKEKEYKKAIEHWLKTYRDDPSQTMALVYLGQAYFGLGEYEKAIVSYSAFLKKHPTEAKALQLRAETYGEMIKVLREGEKNATTEEKATVGALVQILQAKQDADQAKYIALNVTEEKKKLKELVQELSHPPASSPEEMQAKLQTLEYLAQRYLKLGSASFEDSKDAELVRAELSHLAAEAYVAMAKLADSSSFDDIRKLASLYDAQHFLAQGEIDSAQGVLEKICAEGETAPAKAQRFLEKIKSDQLRNINLTALEIWEANAVDLATQKNRKANETIDGQIGQAFDLVFSGKSSLDRTAQELSLEKRLIAEVRKKIIAGKAPTIQQALAQLAKTGPADLRAKAHEFYSSSEGLNTTRGEVRGLLIGYVAQIPPDVNLEDHLFRQNFHSAQDNRTLESASLIYIFLKGMTENSEIREKADVQLSMMKEAGVEYASSSIGDVFHGVGEMIVAVYVAAPLYLATLLKLEKMGITGWRGVGLALGAAGTAEGVMLGTIEVGKVGISHQGVRALTPSFIAKTYGANILMMNVLKPFSKAGEVLGPRAARALGLVAKDGTKLAVGGRLVSWGTNHGMGFSGMVISTQLNQGVGFADPHPGDFTQSLAHDLIGYVRFAVAHRFVNHVSGGVLTPHGYHSQAKLVETRILAETNVKRLGYAVKERVTEGEQKGAPVFSDPIGQALYEQVYALSLTREGFSGAKVSKLVSTGQHAQVRSYLKSFGLKPVFAGKHLLGFAEMSLHEKSGVEAPSPSRKNFARLFRRLIASPAFLFVGMSLGAPGNGGGKGKPSFQKPSFSSENEAAYQKVKDDARYIDREGERIETIDDMEWKAREYNYDGMRGEAEVLYVEAARLRAEVEAKPLTAEQIQERMEESYRDAAAAMAEGSRREAFELRAAAEAFAEALAERGELRAAEESKAAIQKEGSRAEAQTTTLEINEEFLGFTSIRVTKVDESKPWKPPVEVEVTKADGSVVTIPADTPFFTFTTPEGKTLTVSAAAAGHIDALHIKGTEAGSHFDFPTLRALLEEAAPKIPTDVATSPGNSAFSVPMGRSMGREGVSTMAELKAEGYLTEADIQTAQVARAHVHELNKNGTPQEKQSFIDQFKAQNPDCKIQFQLVRGLVLIPVVDAPKQPTENLFMVFGPDGKGGKTLYTAAPGRFMPKHPDSKQHTDASGKLNETTFQESSEAWFDTVMLTGKEPEKGPQGPTSPGSGGNDSPLTSPFPQFQKTVDKIMARVPSEKQAEARKAIEAAFAEVPQGADAKTAGQKLGPALKQIEAKYCPKEPKAPAEELPKLEGENYSKLSPEAQAMAAKLKKAGVLTPEMEGELDFYLGFGSGLAVRTAAQGLKNAVGNIETSKNPVAAHTALLGMLFELSPLATVEAMGGTTNPSTPAEPIKVSFMGLKKGKIVEMKNSPVDNDAPYFEGRVWEKKHHSRMNYGEGDAKLNQILKYQAAIEEGHYEMATVEISGNIDPAFLHTLLTVGSPRRFPNVEILYNVELPDGHRVVLPLKPGQPREGSNHTPATLARVHPNTPLTPREQQILRGIEKALAEGDYQVFSGRTLTEADITQSPHAEKLRETMSEGTVDPMKIKDMGVYREYQKILGEKRMGAFETLGADGSTGQNGINHAVLLPFAAVLLFTQPDSASLGPAAGLAFLGAGILAMAVAGKGPSRRVIHQTFQGAEHPEAVKEVLQYAASLEGGKRGVILESYRRYLVEVSQRRLGWGDVFKQFISSFTQIGTMRCFEPNLSDKIRLQRQRAALSIVELAHHLSEPIKDQTLQVAFNTLTELATDGEHFLPWRVEAILGLESLGVQHAHDLQSFTVTRDFLKTLLEDPNEEVRAAASSAITSISARHPQNYRRY